MNIIMNMLFFLQSLIVQLCQGSMAREKGSDLHAEQKNRGWVPFNRNLFY